MRLVFDTSSLIPACLNPEREPAQILRRSLLMHEVFASAATLGELAAVLSRDKFNAWRPLQQRLEWLHLLQQALTLVETSVELTDCRDAKDNKFLELAVSAQAHVLVSSDVHLLEMHPFQGIHILQLADFKAKFLV